jgi:hypothetical protein
MTGPWGQGSESVDNTREKRAAVDNKRNPPVPHHPRQREVPLPAYLAPPGAQQGTAQVSRKSGLSGTPFRAPGERLDPQPGSRQQVDVEQRYPQDSASRASCPQICSRHAARVLHVRPSTHECNCRSRPASR